MTNGFNRLESISDPEEYKAKSVLDLMSLKGKVTVVTGAARGIGLGLARGAAELGSDVAILDILEQPAEDLKSWEGLGVRVKYYRTDVTKPEDLATVFESINGEFGRIDNCVTAAGIVIDKPFLDHDWEESMKVLNINVMGSILCAQLAAKYMRKQNQGSIVMLGSTAAHGATPSRNMAVYSASKGAIISLTRSLAVELAQFGIRVNSVSPGFIATEMILDATRKDPDLWKSFNSTPPLQRVGTRGDLKGIVACLLTDAAAYTTGADIVVDGGLSSGQA